MSTIFKFGISPIPGDYHLELPPGSEILSAAVQRGAPVLYALVNANERVGAREPVKLGYTVAFTASEVHFGASDLLGTLVLDSIGIVIHVFRS